MILKVLTKEGRLKEYRERIKEYRQNRTLKKKDERIFYLKVWSECNNSYQEPDAKETKEFRASMRTEKPNG